MYVSTISHRVPIEFPNPTRNSWRVFERLNGKITTLNYRKIFPRQDEANGKTNVPTLTSVASPHLTDLESPFERKTFSVDRVMSEPVEPRFELFLLLEFRDIFSSSIINAIPCHFVNTTAHQQPQQSVTSGQISLVDIYLSGLRRNFVAYFRFPSLMLTGV